MFRKIVIYATLICFIACVQGCTSRYTIPTEELEQKPVHRNVTVETIDGDVYDFRYVTVYDDSIIGYSLVYDDMGRHVVDSFLVNIQLGDVESVRVLKYDAAKMSWYTLLVVGVVALVGVVAIIIAFSHEVWY